jgi:hypothetical protein
MDTWEGGLRATGEALEPEKSFRYLIRFCWKNGQWAYVSNEETPASISVRNHAGNRVELERLEVTEARKTLGVKTAPIGDNTAQYEHMLEASQKWAAQIKPSNLRQIDAWLALRSTIWKTLEYPLTCMTLTEKQCEKIMRPTMSAGLAKFHICRSFPTSLLHAGAEALGAGLPHLFTVQGITRMSTLVSHSPRGSITSLLLRAAMEAPLQEAGCGPSPWYPEVKAVLQAITKTWMSSVKTFIANNCIDLHHNIRMEFTHRKTHFSWKTLLNREPRHQN